MWVGLVVATPSVNPLPLTENAYKHPRLSAATWVAARLPRLFAVIGALLLVALTVIAVLITRHVVRAQVGSDLDALLTTTVNGIEVWYAEQSRYAIRLARREPLRLHGLALIEGTTEDAAASLTAIDHYLASQFVGIMVVDRNLRLHASSITGWDLGSLPDDITQRLRQALSGEPLVTRPFLIGSETAQHAVVLLALPLRSRNGADIGGALLLASDPLKGLTPLMRGAWRNDQGESYLASRDGRILVGSRTFDELRQLGLVPSTATPRAMNVTLGDPGRRLTPQAPFTGRDTLAPTPITRGLAESLSGEHLDGFRDYRGNHVIAAWRWLPDLNVGAICTIDIAHAFRAVRALERTFLVALLIAATGLGLGLMWFRRADNALQRAWQVQRRIDELDRYVLGDKIGEGAMGSVFRATHARLRRAAAIKVIRPHAMTGENIARFEREAQLTCRLTHPNTVQIFDYGTFADGSLYYVMEYLHGMSLQALVRRFGAQPPGRVIHILSQALGALAEAHQLGLVHRDIKPSNLFLAVCGGVPDVVKLLDFGLARDHESDAIGLTHKDSVLGSPACMAPELIVRSSTVLTGSCDLYSLACVGYWLLTGSEVFEHATVMATLHAHCHEVPESPSMRLGRTVPSDIERVILRGLAKQPDERFADAATFRAALLACTDTTTWTESLAQQWWRDIASHPGNPVDPQAPTRTLPATP